MLKKFVCIVCPNGCEISAEVDNDKVVRIDGATCKKGEEYVTNEIVNPMRTIATSVLLQGGCLPLAPVRIDKPVPKKEIFHVVEALRKVTLQAPVHIGDVALQNVCGYDCNAIVTKNIAKAEA